MAIKYTYHSDLDKMSKGKRNVVLCIDGTWNDPSDGSQSGRGNTNVYRLSQALDRNAKNQFVRYFPGVGNQQDHSMLGQLFGGAFGTGGNQIRDHAYTVLVTNYRPGDRIFIFGFSRGAAIARMLAMKVQQEGIPESITVIKDNDGEFDDYESHGKSLKVDIEMLGVWDTVASFGIPVNLFGIPFQKINLFRDFTVAKNVKKAYHLLAIDENRSPYEPTLMNHDPKRIEEIWFTGVHSDVGGGYDRRRLGDITLRYMITRAQKHGLVFFDEAVEEVSENVKGEGLLHQHKKRLFGYKMGQRKIVVQANNKVAKLLQPKIHQSAINRMKKMGKAYAPKNLVALKGKYQVVS
ncbi:MAG: DUF2235 domain-containing protein [Nitrospirae bacterium]|nr:DUF2235 domain-containing protein [Nitrospirota bacterium]MDA1303090.1 DUF2235 domain-containing protein [Nitrospirota bacterium]